MRLDRILAAAFVVLVSTAIIGFSAGNTGASFTASSTNPNQSWATSNVAAPASETATSAAAGQINLSWPATTTPANGHTVTYLVFRGGVQIGSTSSLSYSDTPSADGTYTYYIQTKIAQGAGFFTSGNSPSQSPLSDRTAPSMSISCNSGACGGWVTNSTVIVSGTDAGTGMSSVTYSLDGGANVVTAGSTKTFNPADGTHTVAYYGTDVAGNASSTANQTVKIDTTAPTNASALTGATPGGGNPAGTVNLSWTAGSDATSGLAGYTIHRSGAVTSCPAVSPANYPTTYAVGVVTSTQVAGMTSGSKYCFYITATDVAGNVSTNSAAAGPTKAR